VRKVKLVEGDILLDFFMDCFLISSAIILKRSCLKQSGIFNKNLEVGEDFEFFFRLAKYFNAGVAKEKLFERRVWTESLSKQNFELNKKIDIQTVTRFIKNNKNFYTQNSRDVDARMSQLYIKFGYAYLEHGKNWKAFKGFLDARKYNKRSFKLKYLIQCLLPLFVKRTLKRILYAKSKHYHTYL
jgi:hypothetical protein